MAMSDHEKVRELLALSAADALTRAEEEHRADRRPERPHPTNQQALRFPDLRARERLRICRCFGPRTTEASCRW